MRYYGEGRDSARFPITAPALWVMMMYHLSVVYPVVGRAPAAGGETPERFSLSQSISEEIPDACYSKKMGY